MPRPRPSASAISPLLLLLVLLLALANTTTLTHAFLLPSPPSPASAPRRLPSLPSSLPSSPLHAVPDGLLDENGELQYDAPTRARIETLIKENKIVLFMKGNRLFPSCGFSNTAIRILGQLSVSLREGEGGREGGREGELGDIKNVPSTCSVQPVTLCCVTLLWQAMGC